MPYTRRSRGSLPQYSTPESIACSGTSVVGGAGYASFFLLCQISSASPAALKVRGGRKILETDIDTREIRLNSWSLLDSTFPESKPAAISSNVAAELRFAPGRISNSNRRGFLKACHQTLAQPDQLSVENDVGIIGGRLVSWSRRHDGVQE